MRNDIYRKDLTGYRKKLNTKKTNVVLHYKTDFLFPDDGLSFHWTKDCVSNPHTHDFYEFAIITEGDFTHNINDELKTLPYSSMAFILPSDIHALYPNSPCTQINIAVTEEKLKCLCEHISPRLFNELISSTSHGTSIILQDFELQWFLDRANQITTLFTISEKHNYVQLLITEMIFSAISITCRNQQNSDYPKWFCELLLKIQTADWSVLKVNDIYKWSHYSPSVINNYFKKYTGQTIVSYVKKIKLKKARNLLLTTDFDILTIASMLGYDSLSHFNRIFRFATGKSPNTYRKEFKQSSSREKN